jgi:hypothetical protein
MATNFIKEAAPAKDPTRGLSLSACNQPAEANAGQKKTRWVIRGSRLFNPMSWPLARRREYTGSLTMCQSGSPPVLLLQLLLERLIDEVRDRLRKIGIGAVGAAAQAFHLAPRAIVGWRCLITVGYEFAIRVG